MTERPPQDQPPTATDGMIVCDRLVRIFSGDGIEVQALQGLDLLIADGELTAVIGAAGSGKSTLMNILAGLDTPTAGAVFVAGHNLGAMTAKERLAYRRSVAGFIWQQTSRNLLPYMTARQNVLLPMRLSSLGRRERLRRAALLLDTLGMAYCADRTRITCPAASSSAPRSPRRWRTSRRCCWPTSPPASWTPRPPRTCSPPCRPPTRARRHGAGGHPTIRPWDRRFAGRSPSGTARPGSETIRHAATRRAGRDHAARTRVRDAGQGWPGSAPARHDQASRHAEPGRTAGGA